MKIFTAKTNCKKTALAFLGLLFCLMTGLKSWGQTTVPFTTPGTTTWTCPVGVSSITVECWGAGGAGAGSGGNTPNGTGGGGGGAYAKTTTISVNPGTTYNITVGTGGVGDNGSGNNGTASTGVFGAVTVSAAGGTGGTTATSGAGGAGGTVAASTGTTRFAGGAGATGSNGIYGGGGGSSAGTALGGNNGSTSNGGVAVTGGGAGGAGATVNNTGGIDGLVPGGGGGGVRRNAIGGDGARGQINITYTQLTYKSQINSINFGSSSWCVGETRSVTVSITNTGTATWTDGAGGTADINIGLKWNSDPDYGSPPGNIGRQNAGGLAPGATAIYTFPIVTPVIASGTDNLNVDVVYEGVSWFRDNNGGVGPGNPKVGNAQYLSSPITIVSTPAVPGVITGTTPQCPGLTGQQYSIASVTNATTYTWTVPAGWIITAGQGTTTLTVTTGTAGQNGNISVTAGNSCGTSAASTKAVTVNPGTPAVPGVITGTTPQCPGLTGQQYSIASVTNATTYTWTVPAGWIITAGQGTTTLTVTTGTAGQNGNISVTAGNSCGTSAASTKAVTVNPGTPAVPGVITGTTPQCPGLTGQQYSIASVTNATTYTWTVPAGWIITAGQGTTTLTVTTGTAGQNGNISVTAGNSCGTSAASTKAVTVNPGTPAVPGVITGTTPQCPGLTGQQYSIASVTNATTYTWTVPAGWIITAGQGTTTLTVTTGTAGQNGNISVTAGNSCGTSAASTKAVTVNPGTPAVPGVITGTTPQCPGLTGQQYSIASVTNATTYTWTVPAGWIITAGQGTTTLTVTTGTAGQNGNISVTAGNSCGTSAASTKAVTVNPGTPAVPGVITGTTPQCPGLTGQQYSIASVTNATTYTWTVPAGWIITAGQGTTTLTVTTGTAGQNGNISVTAGNSCGTSAAQTKAVTVNPGTPAAPGTISGTTPQCPGVTGQVYSITAVANATTYTWAVPTGWTITAGTGTNSITVTTGGAGQNGNITVTAGNSCGTSAASILPVVVNPTPVVTSNNNVSICNGDNTNITLTASTPSTFTWTLGTVSLNITGASAGSGSAINQVLINSDLSLSGTVEYIVTPTSTDGGCPGNPYTITVIVNAPVAIVNQPVSDTTCATLPVSFVVNATGTGLMYQWYYNGIALSDNSNISGSQAAELDIDQADAGDVGDYWVIVKGTSPCGNVSSDTVNLVINQSITINTQPLSQTVCSGGTAVFTINASSATGVTYQWRKGYINLADGTLGDGAIISGAATNTLTITGITAAEAASNYNVLLSSPGGDCDSAKSKNVKLTVNPIPTVNPVSDVQICNGLNSGVIPFTSSVTGTVYNWSNSDPSIGLGTSGTGNIPSFTATNTGNVPVAAVITVTPTYTNGGTTCTGSQITFNIEVDPTPNVIATPSSQEICSGSSTSVALSSNVTTATFSWTVVQTGVSGASASSGNLINQTLTATGTVQGTAVYTITSSAYGCSSTQTVTVKVNPIPTVTATPIGKTICSGSAPSIALNSNVPGATFSWTVVQTNVTGASNGGGTSISQVLTATTSSQGQAVYTVTPLFNGCSGTPIIVTIKVNPTPVVTDYSTSICSGNSVSYTPVNGSGNIIPTGTTYTWSAPVVAGITGTISGTDQSSFNSGTLSNSTSNPINVVYTVFPTAGAGVGGCTGNSFKVIITVKPVASVSVTPASQEICSGGTFTIDVASAVPGTITNWSVAGGAYPANITSSLGTNGSGAINGTMSNSNPAHSAIPVTFNVSITATNGCATTTSVTIVVDALLTTPVIAASQILCGNSNPSPLTSTVSGGRGNYSYQWQRSTISSTGPWTNVGGNSPTYTPPRPGSTTYYQLVVTDGCGTVTSIPINISTATDFGLSFNGSNINSAYCSGTSFWNYEVSGSIFGSLFGNKSIRYTWQSVNNPTDFTATLPNGNNLPSGTSYGYDSTTFFGLITIYDGNALFTVHNSTNAYSTGRLYITPNVYNNDGTLYCSLTPDSVIVTINPIPVIANSTTSTCSGVAFTYSPPNGSPSGNVVPTNTSYTWTVPANSLGATNQNTPQSSISQTLTNNTTSPQTVRYTVIPKYTGSPTPNCPGSSFFLDVTVNPNVTAGTVSGPASLCKEVTTTIGTFTSNGTSGGTWLSSDPTVATVNSTTGVVTTINAGTTNIIYKVNSGCGSPVSSTKTLIVNDDATAGTLSGTPTSICIGQTTTYSTNGTIGGTWNSSNSFIATVSNTGVVTGVTGGTATITYTVAVGSCNSSPASASLPVTVKPVAGQWTGIASIDWNEPNNWGCGGVPTAATDVVIPSTGVTNFPLISLANALAKSVTINSGASLTMSGIYNLTITNGGKFTNNNNNTAFNASGSTGAVVFAGTGTINGLASTTFNNITLYGSVDFPTKSGTAYSIITGKLLLNSGGSVNSSVSTHTPKYTSSSSLIYNTGIVMPSGNEWNDGNASAINDFGIPQSVVVQSGTITLINAGSSTNNRSSAGSLTINAGAGLVLNSSPNPELYVAGDWNNSGSFTANTHTVTLNGSATQTVSGSTVFYNLTLQNSINFGSSVTIINNSLSNSTGIMMPGTSTFIFTGTGATPSMIGSNAKNFYNLQINSGGTPITHNTGLPNSNIHIANSFVNNGTLNEGSGFTFFFDKSSATETFTGSGVSNFDNLTIGDGAGFAPAVKLNASANFVIKGGNMGFKNNSTYNGNANSVTFTSTSPSSVSGTGTANFSRAITNVALDLAASVTVSSTIKDTLRINTGGNIINNHSPVYANTATLVYQTTDVFRTPGPEWLNGSIAGSGVPQNVAVTNTNSVVLAADRNVPGTLTLANGNLDINGKTLTVNGGFTGTGGYLKGSVTSNLIAGGAGTINFNAAANYLKNFTINNSANLSLGNALNIATGDSINGYGMVVADGGLISNGNLTLKSDINGTAMVGQSGGSITGDVTVERFIPAYRAWRFLAVPFSSSGQTINQAWQEGATPFPDPNVLSYPVPSVYNPNPGYGMQITYNGPANGFDMNITQNPSLVLWDVPTQKWTLSAPSTTGTYITAYPAYEVYVRGSRANNLAAGVYALPDNTTLRIKGVLNENGSAISAGTLSGSDQQYVLIGNPFASPVNVIDAINSGGSAGIDPTTFTVMDPKFNNDGRNVGAYVVYNTGINNWMPFGISYPSGYPPVVQSGQGLMVKLQGSGTHQVSFAQANKYTGQQAGVFGLQKQKTEPAQQAAVIYTNLMSKAVSKDSLCIADGIAAGFRQDFSDAVTSDDVPKLWNAGENIALVRDAVPLSIEMRQLPVLTDTLFYRLYLRQQPYTLKIFSQNLPAATLRAWLVDKYLNTKTDVRLTDTTLYSFTPNTDTNSYRNRFMLVFNRQLQTTPVPVSKATNQKDPNTTGIAKNPVSVMETGSITIQPNPVTDIKNAYLKFEQMQKGLYEVTIYSIKGQKLASDELEYDGSKTRYKLPSIASLSNGVYTITIINQASKQLTSLKLAVNK